MKRFCLCAAVLLACLIGLAGCEASSSVRSPEQRRAHQRRIIENDLKLLVDDWDTLWLMDRPSRLSKWVER